MVDSDILLSVRGVNSNFAFQTKRIIQLGNLICLRQVRIEVVLSVKNRKLADVAAQCHTSLYRIFYSSLVDDRQCARHTGADRTAAGVLASAEFCTTGTKNFGFGQELRMDFQTNNRNIWWHDKTAPPYFNTGTAVSNCCSKASATCRMVASSNCLPTMDIPIGMPAAL